MLQAKSFKEFLADPVFMNLSPTVIEQERIALIDSDIQTSPNNVHVLCAGGEFDDNTAPLVMLYQLHLIATTGTSPQAALGLEPDATITMQYVTNRNHSQFWEILTQLVDHSPWFKQYFKEHNAIIGEKSIHIDIQNINLTQVIPSMCQIRGKTTAFIAIDSSVDIQEETDGVSILSATDCSLATVRLAADKANLPYTGFLFQYN